MENEDGICPAWKGFMGNHFRSIIATKGWIWRIILEGGTLEHFLFIKKDKLACGTILLNVVDFLLHHVTCVKTTNDAWDIWEKTCYQHIASTSRVYNLKMKAP